jgi:hypothetical protein
MNMKKNLILAATMAALTAGAGLSANAADKTFLTMDSFPAGTAAGQFGIAFSQVVQKNLPVEIQVTIGKPATKSAIDAAKGKVDLILTAPAINFLMKKNLAMYKKVKDAPQLVSKLRGFVNYPLGPYHIIVYEDSGIKTLADLKGKKVFLGPPAGAATNTAKQIVAAATGMKPGEDFEVVRFDWKSAETAFLDRQMDAYFIPTTVPSASIEQFSLVSKIRILGIPDDVWDTPGMKKVLAMPGRTIESIPAGIYKNQANEGPVKSVGGWVGIGSNMDMDATLVYNMTKAFWDNIAEIHATAEWMKVITLKTALNEMNIPLHAGAYRYYKEIGVKVPDALIPPEAK